MSWALFVEGDYDEVFVRWLLGALDVEDVQLNRINGGVSKRAHSRFPGHALTPTGVMAIRCKQFHLPDL